MARAHGTWAQLWARRDWIDQIREQERHRQRG
jgi:hypothetical protein